MGVYTFWEILLKIWQHYLKPYVLTIKAKDKFKKKLD